MDATQKLIKHSALLFALVITLCLSAPAWAQPTFSLSTAALTLGGGVTGSDVQVNSSSASTPITFQVTTSYDGTNGNSQWLSVNPSGNTTPASIAINLGNLAGLPSGPHQAFVTLHATDSSGAPDATITVSFNNSTGGGGTGSLAATPSSIVLSAVAGSQTSQNVTISTTSAAQVQLMAPSISAPSCGGAWLTAGFAGSSIISSTSTTTLTINGNASGLSTASCQGTVTITPTFGSAVSISVTMNVNGTAGGGVIIPSQSTVNLSFTTNSGNFPSQSLTLSSSTGQQLYNATASSNNGWLLVNGSQSVFSQSIANSLIVSLSSNANAMGTGSYQGTIQLTDPNSGVALASITVNLSVNGGTTAGLIVSPNPISMPAAAVNGSQTQIAVSASSANGGVFSFSVGSSGWLSGSSSASGTSLNPGNTASITLTANPFGLTAGTYNGTLTVNIGSLSTNVNVTLVVGGGSGGGTATAVAPSSVSLSYQSGTNPNFINRPLLAITGPDGSWTSTISTNATWLSLSPAAGTLPATNQAMIVANPASLAVGNYSGTITITTAGGTSSVAVNLAVLQGAVLLTTPGSAVFNYQTGTSAPPGLQVFPANSDGSALNFTATASDPWVIVNQQSGSTVFSVQVDPTGKSAGVYSSSVIINETTATNNPMSFPVVLVVNGGGTGGGTGTLFFSPTSLSFSSANGVTPNPQVLSVSANVTTPFTVASSASWLTVAPTSTNTTANLSVSVSPTGLAANSTNTATLTFTANGVNQTVNVTYVVGSGSGTGNNVTVTCLTSCGATQPGMSFSAQAGSANLTGTLSVASASGASSVSFTVQATSTGGTWLSTSAGSGTLTTPVNPLTVTVNPAGLSAGTYTGNIAIVPNGGTTVNVPVSLTVTAAPTISATPTTLSFSFRAGDNAPAPQTVNVSGGGSALTFSATASPSGTWLSASPATGTTPATGTAPVTVSVDPTNLSAGTYSGTVTIAGTGTATGTVTVNVTLTVTAPLPTIARVVNAASYQGNSVSPGEIITLFASDAQHPIGPATPAGLTLDSSGKVATTLGGVQVLVNGFASPLIYVSATQVSAVVPYEVAQFVSANILVRFLGQSSNGVAMAVSTTSPGIFTLNSSGTGPGAILNQNFSVNSPSNPASKGEVVTVYLTGEGQTSPAGVTGKVTTVSSSPPPLTPAPLLPIGVTVGGQAANYTFAGEAPGFVSGVLQLNVQIPASAATGDLPIVVSIGSNPSQTGVTVSVK